MISRKSTRLIAEAYTNLFSRRRSSGSSEFIIKADAVYDFLYDRDFPAYFCNILKQNIYIRGFKELIMKLHTGETLATGTPKWTWEQRQTLAQKYLYDMAEAIIRHKDTLEERFHSYEIRTIEDLIKELELDGYEVKNGKLLISEADVLDTREEIGVIESLYNEVGLDNTETTFHHLQLSNEHYMNNKWDDSISNSRKFLECVLREVAAFHSRY